jgi:hypothetical protein
MASCSRLTAVLLELDELELDDELEWLLLLEDDELLLLDEELLLLEDDELCDELDELEWLDDELDDELDDDDELECELLLELLLDDELEDHWMHSLRSLVPGYDHMPLLHFCLPTWS